MEYTDWGLDALVTRVRRKLGTNWNLVTVKGRGYMLVRGERPSQALSAILGKEESPVATGGGIYPTEEYLEYMNDKKRERKVYADLIKAVERELKIGKNWKRVLCVNSYSYDNVDAVARWLPKAKIYFVHHDPRAIKLHEERIRELGIGERVETIADDLRESKLKSEYFNLVINDFRINFNLDHAQNLAMLMEMRRVIGEGGVALVSTVVDGRYEGEKYGNDQEKAPINKRNPGTFQADEHLVRRCYSVPYYRQLFEKAGFAEIVEFDILEGKRWGAKKRTSTTNSNQGPYYRRWLVKK